MIAPMLLTKEHYDLIAQFEKDDNFLRSRRFDKEEKALWKIGHVYQDGVTNELFLAYRIGYAFGKTTTA